MSAADAQTLKMLDDEERQLKELVRRHRALARRLLQYQGLVGV